MNTTGEKSRSENSLGKGRRFKSMYIKQLHYQILTWYPQWASPHCRWVWREERIWRRCSCWQSPSWSCWWVQWGVCQNQRNRANSFRCRWGVDAVPNPCWTICIRRSTANTAGRDAQSTVMSQHISRGSNSPACSVPRRISAPPCWRGNPPLVCWCWVSIGAFPCVHDMPHWQCQRTTMSWQSLRA